MIQAFFFCYFGGVKKVLSTAQIRLADSYTIEHEPVSSLLLMERAAYACFNWLVMNIGLKQPYRIFCGTGNNGGDGLVIADYLLSQNAEVIVYVVRYVKTSSPDFSENEKRILNKFPDNIINIYSRSDFPVLNVDDIIIDALFGTGLNKVPQGLSAEIIQYINQKGRRVIAIDMPSGLMGDAPSNDHQETIIRASDTLAFQLKKLSFYFPFSGSYCGNVHVIDIKLSEQFMASCKVNYYETEPQDIQQLLHSRKLFSHKGNYGHALLLCGSYGKMGAAVLSAKSALRSGAGLITVNIPACGYAILQAAVPEAMVIPDHNEYFLTESIDYSKYNAIGIGCGIDTNAKTAELIKKLFNEYKRPLVIDADAINILALNKGLLQLIPAQCILTPHPKEFERLAGKSSNDFERNKLQVELSRQYSCYIILKGHYSCISTPDGNCYFNPTGNAGMATAGSGDVLTGLLTGLLACGYSSFETAIIGTFLHGRAGDIAAKKTGMESLIATDIINNIGYAFQSVTNS